MPAASAMAAPVQWVASCGGSVAVKATTRSMTYWPSGATREGRVLSRGSPPLDVIRRALESAGIEFIDENGGGADVRLRR